MDLTDGSGKALEENRRLRETMRDLVALSTLPAIWIGLGRDGIARSLSDALLTTLSLDLVYVRLAGYIGQSDVEVVRSKQGDGPRLDEVVKATLAPLLVETSTTPATIPDPCGEGILRVAVIRFGVGDDHGALIACSRRADFPTPQDRLLLGVGANQTAIVVQRQKAEDQAHQQREWLRITLASIGDAVIATDREGRVTFLNSIAQKLTGWTLDDATGEQLQSIFTIVNEESRQPVESPVDKVLRNGIVVGLANHTVLISKDGTELPIDDSAAPIRNSSGDIIGVVLVFRGVTEQRRAEQLRDARLAVTQVLNQGANVQDAVVGVLRAVCEYLVWDIGFFWTVNDENEGLVCRASWHRPNLAVGKFQSASWNFNFQRGQGLPGRVWDTSQPVWIPDVLKDKNFPRLSAAAQVGFHSAFAYPVVIDKRVLGVIEFFTKHTREPDAGLLEMMGTVAGSVGQFIERKTAEDELRRSEEELAEFFENASVGLHWVGPDGTILRANKAELDMLGYSREEYVGSSIADFHVDRDVISDILNKLKAGEKLSEYPARLRCKDGSIKDVLIDSSVLWNEGQFIHTRCLTRDVTERMRAEKGLAEARMQLDSALEAGAIVTWTWDIPNNRLFGDRKLASLFNLPLSDADGDLLERYIQSIHPDDAPIVISALDHSLETGEDYKADYRIMESNGAVRWVTARGRVECDASGKKVRMPGVLVDITERKQLEEELRLRVGQLAEADRRKDEFLATLAHELRNPLAPIRNSLEILKMPRVEAGAIEQTRDMMERQVHHLVRLVDDLLDVSRVMRGRIDLRKEQVELATVVARAVETVQSLIAMQGHQLELSLPRESLLLDADPVRLAQLVGNLLTNSAKYTEANGHIWLSARREGDDAVLRVSDDGIGIAPDMLPHVFELFVQADHASTRAQGGLGIGLTLVKNLAQLHGGTIEAYSAGLGKGCEFTVRLPLLLRQSSESNEEAGAEQKHNTETLRSGHRLLIVDDNQDAAESLALLLRLQGHEVRVAHDGPSALATATSCLPHMVFLDIGMPGMDGYEVARRMREQPGLKTVVLAALTGWGQQEDRRRTFEAGFDHHLVKPLEAKTLERLLDQL
jgi:PAS domain S-box-containing protein